MSLCISSAMTMSSSGLDIISSTSRPCLLDQYLLYQYLLMRILFLMVTCLHTHLHCRLSHFWYLLQVRVLRRHCSVGLGPNIDKYLSIGRNGILCTGLNNGLFDVGFLNVGSLMNGFSTIAGFLLAGFRCLCLLSASAC